MIVTQRILHIHHILPPQIKIEYLKLERYEIIVKLTCALDYLGGKFVPVWGCKGLRTQKERCARSSPIVVDLHRHPHPWNLEWTPTKISYQNTRDRFPSFLWTWRTRSSMNSRKDTHDSDTASIIVCTRSALICNQRVLFPISKAARIHALEQEHNWKNKVA